MRVHAIVDADGNLVACGPTAPEGARPKVRFPPDPAKLAINSISPASSRGSRQSTTLIPWRQAT